MCSSLSALVFVLMELRASLEFALPPQARAIIHGNLGALLMSGGKAEQAVEEIDKAVQISVNAELPSASTDLYSVGTTKTPPRGAQHVLADITLCCRPDTGSSVHVLLQIASAHSGTENVLSGMKARDSGIPLK